MNDYSGSTGAPQRLSATSRDGLALAGDVYGPETAQLVLLLHGGGQSKLAWQGAAQRLAHAGYRACAMDLRGHGDSAWSQAGAYRFDDYVADVLAVIDALAARSAVLVGASLGGLISLLVAAHDPTRATALALADVTPWIDESIGDRMRGDLRSAARGFASLEDASRAIAQMRGVPPPDDGAERLRRHLRVGDDGRFYFRWDARLVQDQLLRGGGEGGLFQRAAARLDLPILVMRAEHSRLTSAEEVEAFRAVQPALETTLITRAGHMVTGDVNDRYADALLAFLDRCAIPADSP